MNKILVFTSYTKVHIYIVIKMGLTIRIFVYLFLPTAMQMLYYSIKNCCKTADLQTLLTFRTLIAKTTIKQRLFIFADTVGIDSGIVLANITTITTKGLNTFN